MSTRGRLHGLVAAVCFTVASGSLTSALAIPIRTSGPLTGPGDGLNARWVNTSFAPDHIDKAVAGLALGPGQVGYVGEVNQIAPYIDYGDGCFLCAGASPGTTLRDPLTPDDNFAVKFSGFLNITTGGSYSFDAYTDDGFRLTIGGEKVGEHPNNRAPGTTIVTVDLVPGLYSFSFISWEWTTWFVNELRWKTPGSANFSVPGSGAEKVFFTTFQSAVPEAETLTLLVTGLLGLGLWYRRSRH